MITALGLIKKGMDKYIQKIPGGIRIQELQKFTVLGSSHILRKALSIIQVDFNLIVTLGPRMGSVIMTYHSIKSKAIDINKAHNHNLYIWAEKGTESNVSCPSNSSWGLNLEFLIQSPLSQTQQIQYLHPH